MDEGAGFSVQPPSSEERWRWPRPSRGLKRQLVAGLLAMLVNVALIGGVAWHDRTQQATAGQEIPVEVVDHVPAQQEAKPEQPQQDPPKPEPPSDDTPPSLGIPQSTARQPSAPAAAPPEPEAPPDAASAPAPSAPSQPVEVDVSHGVAAGPPTATPSDEPRSDEAPSAAASDDAAAPPPPEPTETDAATSEHRLVPRSFRAAAVAGASVQSQDDYKNLVFGMLERAKRLPPQTATRNGRMAAYVRFMIDRAGNLVSLSLVGSSGDAELDAEALALVRRAAPFPKPPAEGTLLTFTPVILFGYE